MVESVALSGALSLLKASKTGGAEGGEEQLPVVGRNQVIQHRIDGGAHIEEHVCHHVKVVVEVIQASVNRQRGQEKNECRQY